MNFKRVFKSAISHAAVFAGGFIIKRVAFTAAVSAVSVAATVGGLDIIQREGKVNKAYLDTNGTPTICMGHTSDPEYPFKMGDEWSDEKCAEVFEHDHAEALSYVDRLVTVPLEQHQRAALASLVYNIGGGAFANSTLLRVLNNGDYGAVPAQMRRWNKETIDGRKVVSRGLSIRREGEIRQWLGEG